MPNRNLTNLAILYDFAAKELDKVLKAGIPYSDERVLKKLSLLHETSRTMSLVFQIENLRNGKKQDGAQKNVDLPAETGGKDPAEATAQDNTFNPNQGNSGHQGWTPFG